MLSRTRLLQLGTLSSRRTYARVATEHVNIVEVGPRDGLQNEKGNIPVQTKVELINRLARAGLKTIETGSFVSPKWVPQMAGTAEVIQAMERLPSVNYQVLIPNKKGLDLFLSNAATSGSDISIFTAASDEFSLKNTNATVKDSLAQLAPVCKTALDNGLRVRGYVSVVVACPFSGKVDPKVVRDVSKELVEMGCYEISLGDTVGMGTPASIAEMLEEVKKAVPVEKLAGHYHDTYGTAIANVLKSLEHGVRTFDSSVGGLGGCPYSPGATGNLATEDILYALQGSQYTTGDVRYEEIAEIGWWINQQLGRETGSSVGRALLSKRRREEATAQPAQAKL